MQQTMASLIRLAPKTPLARESSKLTFSLKPNHLLDSKEDREGHTLDSAPVMMKEEAT